MTYREHSAQLARGLGHLAVTGSSRALDADGLDVAVAGRRETLELLRTVLADTTGISRDDTALVQWRSRASDRRRVEELEAHPVAVLARTLAGHPSPRPRQAPSDTLASSTVGGAHRAWARAARHALLASHEWSTRPARSSPDQQWSAVADVAALAYTVAVLDRDLAEVASRLPGVDPALAESLAASTTSGLRVAAREATLLAAAGPLPDWGDPGPDTAPTRVLMVRSPQEVAAAQGRLATQVANADQLSPPAVTLLATGQARILTAAAVALRGVDDGRSGRAAQLAQQLTSSVADRHRLAALMPDDPRPVLQTREVLQHLRAVGDRGWSGPQARAYLPALAAVVDRSPAVVQALSRSADQAVRTGRWIVPNTAARRANEPLWRRATRADPEPRLCAALSAVAAHAAAFTPPAPPSTAPSMPSPRETLAGVAGLGRRTRPARPGQRPETGLSRD